LEFEDFLENGTKPEKIKKTHDSSEKYFSLSSQEKRGNPYNSSISFLLSIFNRFPGSLIKYPHCIEKLSFIVTTMCYNNA
jgi:hypothetical protein